KDTRPRKKKERAPSQAHRVPLSRPAVEILSAAKRRNDKRTERQGGPSIWVFPGRRHGKPVTEVKRVLAEIREAAGIKEHWQAHDLRRTCATGLAELEIEESIISRILNHSLPGDAAPVTGVYNRHQYDKQKREALDAWAKKLTVIVSGLKVAKE